MHQKLDTDQHLDIFDHLFLTNDINAVGPHHTSKINWNTGPIINTTPLTGISLGSLRLFVWIR